MGSREDAEQYIADMFAKRGFTLDLHRYMAEFDFRYTNRIKLGVDDQERSDRALRGVVGKRLTYRGPDANNVSKSA